MLTYLLNCLSKRKVYCLQHRMSSIFCQTAAQSISHVHKYQKDVYKSVMRQSLTVDHPEVAYCSHQRRQLLPVGNFFLDCLAVEEWIVDPLHCLQEKSRLGCKFQVMVVEVRLDQTCQ